MKRQNISNMQHLVPPPPFLPFVNLVSKDYGLPYKHFPTFPLFPLKLLTVDLSVFYFRFGYVAHHLAGSLTAPPCKFSSAVSSHSLPLEPAETLQPAKVLEASHHPHGLSLGLGAESFLPRPLLP